MMVNVLLILDGSDNHTQSVMNVLLMTLVMVAIDLLIDPQRLICYLPARPCLNSSVVDKKIFIKSLLNTLK
jgi:hypothetical protein